MISKTQLNKILAESSFDPRKPGPYKAVVDMNDARFLRQRAIELLYEAETHDTDTKVKQAITFLALSRAFKEENKRAKIRRIVNPQTRTPEKENP